MSFNLISESLGENSILYFMYQSRLEQYIELQKDELLALSYFQYDESFVTEYLKRFANSSILSDFISNEIFFDLFTSFKNDDYRFKNARVLEKLISLTYIKYAQFIRVKIVSFYDDLSRLRTKLKKEKWKIKKIKRVPQPIEPIKITLDIRFAIIKRADGKCEGCSSSIYDKPIDVYQVKVDDAINFFAYCENCRDKNIQYILKEPEEKKSNDKSK